MRGTPLIGRKPKVGTTGKNFSNITKEQAEVIKYEKGRSIKGEHDYKAYLERIRWNIAYLKYWSDHYTYNPESGNKKNLLHS